MDFEYIDSCIFLGFVFDENDAYGRYLNTLGYKQHNKGIISHFVMSEILINIIFKSRSTNPLDDQVTKERAFKMVNEFLYELKEENKLKILKLNTRIIDEELIRRIKENDTLLTDDDAFHLIEAIKAKCRYFVTSDKEIIENNKLREYLKTQHKLKIKEIII